MSKILVTGASGELGRQTLQALLETTDPGRLVAMVRDPQKAALLAEQGIEIRQGDYFDSPSLTAAFAGIEKVLLVSAVAFTDRLTQHLKVIEAAKHAGVKHLVYTSIQRKPGSSHVIPMVTESDLATERALAQSGLGYTIVRNGLYQEVLPYMLGPDWADAGIQITAGNGQAAMVSRRDLAQANARILTQPGHENKTYTLGGSEAISFREIANALAVATGREVSYQIVSREKFTARLIAAGFPPAVSDFLHEWVMAVNQGEFAEITGDLQQLIGHKPASCLDFIDMHYRNTETTG